MIHTLSTELSTILLIFCGLVVSFSVFMYVWMLRLTNYVREAVHWVRNNNDKSPSLSRLAELDATVTELTDSYNAILASNKKLRARIGMRATREKRNGTADADDLHSGNDKRALRLAAKSAGFLK